MITYTEHFFVSGDSPFRRELSPPLSFKRKGPILRPLIFRPVRHLGIGLTISRFLLGSGSIEPTGSLRSVDGSIIGDLFHRR